MSHNIFLRLRKEVVLSLTFLFFLLFSFVSCKKDESLLGGKVYDQNDLLSSGGIDTFQLKTYTIAVDSLKTKTPGRTLLGITNDRDFGVMDAGFYTQIRLSGLNPNFGDINNITIDSFVLALEYVGGYGSIGKQTFEVYELDQEMHRDSTYYAHQNLTVKSTNLVNGSGNLTVNPQALTVVGGDTVAAQLRIPLKTTKALQIIQDAANFPAEFGNNDLFSKNYFKGIYVKTNGVVPAENRGMIAYFNLMDADSKLIIYYKEGGEAKTPFSLVMNSDCAYYNHYSINNTGKNIAAVVQQPELGQKEFYAQAGAHRGVIGFPTLKYLPKNIVVHSAKLYLPIQSLPGSSYTFPTQMSMFLKDKPTTEIIATYDPLIKGYVADLKTFVQAYAINTITTDELTISPRSFISSAERVIFNGPATTNKVKPKLILTYTKF
jgi:hypothetical protein